MKINERALKWIKMIVAGGVGGGVAATVAMVSDPAKYTFPRDLGSGKAWPFFISGAGTAIVALLIKSPFGSKLLSSFKESQAQLEENKQVLEQAKSDLKSTVKPPSKPDKS